MQREVMVRKSLRNGTNQLVKATVLSEHNGKLRCVQPGSVGVMKPFVVDAKDAVDASTVFSGSRLAQQQGVVPTRAYPDNRSCLATTLNAAKQVAPAKKSADTMKPSKLMHKSGVTLDSEKDSHDDGNSNDGGGTANFHVGDSVRHKKSGWVGKVAQVHTTKSPKHSLLRVQYQSPSDTQPMLVNHHSSEMESAPQV